MNNNKLITFYRIVAYLLMLGIIHSALTPLFYKTLTPDALWFFGTGLALVFLSLLNIAASRLLVPWLLTMTLIANIIGTLHSIATLFVLKQPQAYLGLCFFVTVLFACWRVRSQMICTDKAH
jgi:hypothetical protein